jgi:hypothetical protein
MVIIMKKLEIRETLQKCIENSYQVHITRCKIDKNPIDCFPLIMSQDLLLVQYIYDFELDGYKLVRIKDMTSIISGKSERFSEFILKEEGILNQIKIPSFPILDKWVNVFRNLKSLEQNIIVECESTESNIFYIGKIVQVMKSSLLLLYFNELGEWDKEPTKIIFKDITSVSFDTRYINIISKYVK